MLQKDIYDKKIMRAVNPAVSATKLDNATKEIEIDEYVFTDEILNGLYRVLEALKNRENYNHVGIWIDGYYGSGKSHFLKYLDYCITPDTRDKALGRLVEAAEKIDFMDPTHDLKFDPSELRDIANWLKSATIDTCIFNLETSYDASTDKKIAFLQVFWNEFNARRGFNKFNISLAQHLEKPLMEKGVFEEFKAQIAEMGGNWDDPTDAADIVDQELDSVLDVACELAPTLDRESIRERIIRRDTVMSIERFAGELNSWLRDKGENYRLILLADEVSQFINKERDRYLNLQEIITRLSEACDNKVWVACTAQQDLSEVLEDCNVLDEKDKEGKIKGRFEVKVSLKGTKPEVITQKRILDKKESVKESLGAIYDRDHDGYALQFKLPHTFETYNSREDFIDFYPFLRYQFRLIMQVFDSFLNLGYVAKEVKGNERSIIKVIHSTAKNNAENEVGKFVAFDELYNIMFEEGLQARGQKAVNNALEVAKKYEKDPAFAKRVVNVLFMICNISATDRMQFAATIDNITTLLIQDIKMPRLVLKEKVEKVIEHLCDNNIIRLEQGKGGNPDWYSFYSEEEMKVAQLINSQQIDNNLLAEKLKDIFNKYLKSLTNKEQYGSRSFPVQILIKGRTFLSSNPDIVVEFVTDADYDTTEQMALKIGNQNKLIFYVGEQLMANRRLLNSLYWYCKVNKYLATPPTSDENVKTREEFKKRANETLLSTIEPELRKIIDSCPVVTGQLVIDSADFHGNKGDDKFRLAMKMHLDSIYNKSALVGGSLPRNSEEFARAVMRPINPGDYEGMNEQLSDAEREVESYLNRQYQEVNVADIVAKFQKPPYGWDTLATLYVVNELVRRHRRDFAYTNIPNVEPQLVANRIIKEQAKFTIRPAVAISPEIISKFSNAWKMIFGIANALSSKDSSTIFRLTREKLDTWKRNYDKTLDQYGQYRFIEPIREARDLMQSWLDERAPEKFFVKVTNDSERAAKLFDTCKEVSQFVNDQLPNYRKLVSYARENRDNFSYVSEDIRPQVAKLQALEDAVWPIALNEYSRIRKVIDAELDKIKNDLRKQITDAYNQTFDQLERACEENGVDKSVLSKRDVTISLRTQSDNILKLRDNINTDDFYAEQTARILRAKPKPIPPTPPVPPTPGDPYPPTPIPTPKAKEPLTIGLRTRTTSALGNEDDVDNYLAGLKKQLMHHINNGESVMIIK